MADKPSLAPPFDPNSLTWRTVAQRCEEEIERLRRILEAPGLGQAETENARGGIAALRDVLNLAKPKADIN